MEKNVFDPRPLSLKKLFEAARYSVPDYQRFYSWTDTQIVKLWDDLYEAFKNKNNVENYFLGSIITVNSGIRGREDIVDGQQRITTLTILFATICQMFDKIELIENYGEDAVTFKEIKNLYLSEKSDVQDIRLKLQAQDQVHTGFVEFIQKTLPNKILDNNFKKPKSSELKNGPKENKYINALYIFKEKLNEIKDEVSEFINFVLNDVVVIKVECSNLEFAIKLFQIINDRGLDLTISDIVKSYLLGHVNDNDKAIVKNNWINTEKLLPYLHTTDMSNYLNYYVHYLLENTPKFSISKVIEQLISCNGDKEKLSKIVTNNDSKNEVVSIVSLTQNFYNFVKAYETIFNLENKYIYSIINLPWDTVWVPILAAIGLADYANEEQEILFKALLKYFYINYIANRTYNQVKQTALNVLKLIKSKASATSISTYINSEIKTHILLSFKTNLTAENVFDEKWIRSVLVLIEYFENDSKDKIIIDKDMHIDHILPIKWAENKKSEWCHISAETSNKYLNSLGNLTLLNYKKNIYATNDGFDTKIKIYDGTDNRIKSQGKTKYAITQKIIDVYNHNGVTTWNKSAIENRGKYLLDKLLNILDIPQCDFDKLNLNN